MKTRIAFLMLAVALAVCVSPLFINSVNAQTTYNFMYAGSPPVTTYQQSYYQQRYLSPAEAYSQPATSVTRCDAYGRCVTKTRTSYGSTLYYEGGYSPSVESAVRQSNFASSYAVPYYPAQSYPSYQSYSRPVYSGYSGGFYGGSCVGGVCTYGY